MIAREWAQRDKLTLRLPPAYIGLRPGDRVDLDLSPRTWRVDECSIDGFVVVAELRPVVLVSAALAADSGRIAALPDVIEADLTLALFDIPDVLRQQSSAPS